MSSHKYSKSFFDQWSAQQKADKAKALKAKSVTQLQADKDACQARLLAADTVKQQLAEAKKLVDLLTALL